VTKHSTIVQSPLKNVKNFNPIAFSEWTASYAPLRFHRCTNTVFSSSSMLHPLIGPTKHFGFVASVDFDCVGKRLLPQKVRAICPPRQRGAWDAAYACLEGLLLRWVSLTCFHTDFLVPGYSILRGRDIPKEYSNRGYIQ
jgi:hypothetical protein